MSKINYQKVSVLVADDFSSFRNTVYGMLSNLGVEQVETASSGEEVLDKCQRRKFDILLCDYDLGPGRNGQHVLEELRYRNLISRRNIFIMVSAEAGRNVVMSAYDCEPDDYLMKPITAMMLQQRMARLIVQRDALRPVYDALERDDLATATDKLIDMSLAEDRYAVAAQKLLGDLFIVQGELNKAEKLYTRALEVRQLDWARLGLAKVKHLQGELELAGSWLDRIVEDNPLYLPAYDVMADNWRQLGETRQSQAAVQRAVEVSPMSILRQKRLADIAIENNDPRTAIEAMRRTVKLGKLSCYGAPQDNFKFARLVSRGLEGETKVSAKLAEEALQALQEAEKHFSLSADERACSRLLSARVLNDDGRRSEAKALLAEAEALLEDASGIDADLDYVALLQSMGEHQKAQALLQLLLEKYADDQGALEALDSYLDEPASASNREMVAAINREGIDLYNEERYDDALDCFERARKQFPKHVGIQLNIAQALIGKLKHGDGAREVIEACRESLLLVASRVDQTHSAYDRFQRLKRKAEQYY